MTAFQDNKLSEILYNIKQSWDFLDFYNRQAGLVDYSLPIIQASAAVENMIILKAYEEGKLDSDFVHSSTGLSSICFR